MKITEYTDDKGNYHVKVEDSTYMKKFRDDKRKALNRARDRFYYHHNKVQHLHFILHRVKSPKRATKILNQIIANTLAMGSMISEMAIIKSSPIPKFPSGAFCCDHHSYVRNGYHAIHESGPEPIINTAPGKIDGFDLIAGDRIGIMKTVKEASQNKTDLSELLKSAFIGDKPKADDKL